jgi:hypothetical protein
MLAALAASCQSQSGYVGYATSHPEFDSITTTVSGPVAGLIWEHADEFSTFSELRWFEDPNGDLEFRGWQSGILSQASVLGPLEIRARIDLGFTWARRQTFSNSNELITVGLGIQPSLWLSDSVALVGQVGYRFYFDQTEATRCEDGHETSNTAGDACFDHGGIASQRQLLEDGHGPELSLGVRFSF